MKQIEDNKNLLQTTSGTVASIGLEQTGKRVAGTLVTPATWALNYAAEGAKPSSIDFGIYATGFVSGPAAIITGLWKSIMDDDISRKLRIIQAKEPAPHSKYIRPCDGLGYAPPQVNAMNVARRGGTAWKTSLGLWVYITDANGLLVADYTPKEFVQLFQPHKPYKPNKDGDFAWGATRR